MNRTTIVPGQPAQRNAFRRQLPERVRARLDAPMPRFEPEVEEAMARNALRSPDVDWKMVTRADVRDFLLAYGAMTLALLTFLM